MQAFSRGEQFPQHRLGFRQLIVAAQRGAQVIHHLVRTLDSLAVVSVVWN